MTSDLFLLKHFNVRRHCSGVGLGDPPLLWLSPSHKACSSECKTVSRTKPRPLVGHKSPTLTPWYKFGACSFNYTEQLVSPCCHSSHFEGSAVLYESVLLLCPKDLVIMVPYVLMTVPDSFHLSFHPVTALT